MEDSKASTIEERCQELGVIPQYIPFVSLAFSNLNSMTNLTSVEKLPGNYRLKLRGITGEVVSVYFIPRRDSDEEYAVGGRTKFGREIEYRFDRATTQMVGPLMYK